MKEIKTVAIYNRESSKGQSDLGTSETQLENNLDFCTSNGWTVAAVFTDGAVSGNSPLEERPDGGKLVELIKSGEIDAVVSANVDRLTRSEKMAERGYIYDLLGEHVTAFASPREGIIHCNDLIGDVTYSIRSAVAKEEREKIKKRAKDGFENARKHNRCSGGGVPYGLKWVNLGKDHPNRGYWEPNEDQVKVLKEFFQLVKKGHALERIADEFNSEGIPTKYGKRWASTTLNQMLKNSFYYTGLLTYEDGVTVDTEIKLFSKAEIAEVRKHRKAHPTTKRKITKNGHYEPGTYLLRGVMHCKCGRIMSPFKSSVGYYRCKRKGCRTNGLNMRKTDRGVWDVFENKLTDSELIHGVLKAENLIPGGNVKEAMKRKKVAEAKLMEITNGKDRLVEQFTLHRISKNRYEKLMVELENNETHYRREKAKAENTTQDVNVMESEAKAVADFFTDHMKAFHELKKIQLSLADADMAIRFKFVPKLIEILKNWKIAVSKTDLSDPTKIKDFLFESKRTILKEAILRGVKITSYKDGSIAVTMLPSQLSATGCFG